MEYLLRSSEFFVEQFDELSEKAKRILEAKLLMLKVNPFRFKRIERHSLFLFRIRFEDNRKEKRVIYLVGKSFVEVLCILDRDKEYKDLNKYLQKLGYL